MFSLVLSASMMVPYLLENPDKFHYMNYIRFYVTSPLNVNLQNSKIDISQDFLDKYSSEIFDMLKEMEVTNYYESGWSIKSKDGLYSELDEYRQRFNEAKDKKYQKLEELDWLIKEGWYGQDEYFNWYITELYKHRAYLEGKRDWETDRSNIYQEYIWQTDFLIKYYSNWIQLKNNFGFSSRESAYRMRELVTDVGWNLKIHPVRVLPSPFSR